MIKTPRYRASSALLAGLLACAALVGCGGGDDVASIINKALDSKAPNLAVGTPTGTITNTDTATAFVAPAWASPAIFVTPGQASASVLIRDCGIDSPTVDAGGRSSASFESIQRSSFVPGTALFTASFVIMANGDAVFSAATSSTGTVAELARINLAEATTRQVHMAVGTEEATQLYLKTNNYPNSGNSSIDVVTQIGSATNNLAKFISHADRNYYVCNISSGALTPRIPPSAARLKERFVPTAAQLAGRVDYLYDNQANSTTLPANQANFKYANLNLTTGLLSAGPSNSTATSNLSPVVMALDPAGTGRYIEEYRAVVRVNLVEVADYRQFELSATTTANGKLVYNMQNTGGALSHNPELGTTVLVSRRPSTP